MIVVEGPDGAGKTTLAKKLSAEFHGAYVHSIGPSPDYENWLLQHTAFVPTHAKTVNDRFFFSELVYGPIFRGKVCFEPQDLAFMLGNVLQCRPLIILCLPSRQHVVGQVVGREDQHIILGGGQWTEDTVQDVYSAYLDLYRGLEQLQYPFMFRYDFVEDSLDKVLDHVAEYLLEVHGIERE